MYRFLVSALVLWLFAGTALAEQYFLTPNTRLSIKTFQLNASKGEFVAWDALSGEFTVSQEGTITLPIVGVISTADLDASSLGPALLKLLQAKVNLLSPPTVSVQVLEYSPIYVVGQVTNAGEYKFHPGMTVLQALALAGGRYRPQQTLSSSDPFGLKGDLQSNRQQILRLMARIARLQAESAGAAEITFPDNLKGGNIDATTIADQEKLLFANRKIALERQIKALGDLRELYSDEIKSLGDKAAGLNASLSMSDAELQRIIGLVDKGVVVASRKMDLQRETADIRTKLLDNDIEMLRARQFQADAVRNAANLRDQQATTIATELQDALAALDQAKVKEVVLRNQIDAIGVSAPVASGPSELVYTIVRERPQPEELKAAENTLVLPGDVVKVQLADSP